MTALRIATMIAWGLLLIYMIPGAWSAMMGRAVRRGDPMRLAVLGMCAVNIGFNLRWLLAPESELLWKFLYVLSIGLAGYIALLARAYGRGPRV